MGEPDHRWGMLLNLEEATPDYLHGFEAGRIWAMLHIVPSPFDCEMHLTNAEVILRMAEAAGRTVRWEELDDTWATVSFGSDPSYVTDD